MIDMSACPAATAWGEAVANRVEHADDCSLAGGGCSAPFGDIRPIYCPEGAALAKTEQAAYQAWRDWRAGLVVSP